MTIPQSTPAPETTQEEWRPVVGFEDIYEVSSFGRVRRLGGQQCLTHGYGVRPYPYVTLSRAGSSRKHRVHRLVAAAFHGPCPPRMIVHHEDNNPDNPHASNLAYITQGDNLRRAYADGLTPRKQKPGRKHSRCRNGHIYTKETTAVTQKGYQSCRICRRVNARRKYHRNKLR